jgi:hypothetical protein
MPDLIYVDASHRYEDVYAECMKSLDYFTDSILCGDDYGWDEVQRAVDDVARQRNMQIELFDDWCWRLKQRHHAVD